EPEFDCLDPVSASAALNAADFVVALAPFASETMKEHADVLLPIGWFTETSGTFVNAEGRWQSFGGVVVPPDGVRPGWKVLRVLGNFFDLKDFDYISSEQVRDELAHIVADLRPDNRVALNEAVALPRSNDGLMRMGDVPIYAVDSLV